MKLSTLVLCVLVSLAAGCFGSPTPRDEEGCDGGHPIEYDNCVPPPHASVDIVDEPDGGKTCLWGLCDPGWGDCDGEPENGCEAQLNTIANCGGCGLACASGLHCVGAWNNARCVFPN